MTEQNTYTKVIKITILSLFLTVVFFGGNRAIAYSSEGEKFNPGDMIMHHIGDDHSWHLFDIGGQSVTIPLPIILYSNEKGLDVFLSSNFYDKNHTLQDYNGYKLDHGHVSISGSEGEVYDLSITKNVTALIVNSVFIFLLFLAVARGYKKNEGKAPSGIQSFFEPIIVFVRDEIAKPNIGKKYESYLPFLLTMFFFVLIGNLIGLMPGSANLTGNIAITMVLALSTLVLTLFSSNKYYWGHIFNPPGVPLPLKFIIVPVEIIGIFTKPFSLMIRLFVAITAGHIVILSLISLTFIFESFVVGIGSAFVVLFINLIELLVAGIQAYVFTLFSSMYIGMAMEEHH